MAQSTFVTERMQTYIQQWAETADRRTVFLRCYLMMTQNMMVAIEKGEFHDSTWVRGLLERFAEYYFVALEAYEKQTDLTPPVWQVAHDATRQTYAILQQLILGVNAHINYDLVLALVDVLASEWQQLSAEQRAQRYADHCHVNDVIGSTIDAVQDTVLEPLEPGLNVVDQAFGPFDEWVISKLIAHWRDAVWQHAIQILDTHDPRQREQMRMAIEAATLHKADAILMQGGPLAFASLF